MKMKKMTLALAMGFACMGVFAFESYDEAISAGKAANAKNDFKTAATAFSDAVAKADVPDKLYTAGSSLAAAYLRAGDKEKSREEWEKLAKNEKIEAGCRTWSLIQVGDTFRAENRLIEAVGKYDEANEVCKQIASIPKLEKDQKSGLGLMEANLLKQQQKNPEAITAYEKLLEQPDFTGKSAAYWELANLYKSTGNVEKGIEICRKGVALNDGMKPDFEALLKILEAQKK